MGKVHLIGNAHLDPAWLWHWQEGYSEVLATFRSALDRIKEYNEFIFTCAGAVYYKWVEETDPAMFEEIRAAVKGGKWVIVGGWWIQPDCNAPSGEAFARHALYSQRYFKEKFGVTAEVGYNVDSFGHNGMLPQILKKSGMSAYVYMRPMDNEKEYPFEQRTFMWRGADGSELPAFRIPQSYAANLFDDLEKKVKSHEELSELTEQPIMCFYGVGNHGGGPTIQNIELLDDLKKHNENYTYSSPNGFFVDVERNALPVLSGDLQHHASGCYTAVMEIKELNRKSEALLCSAEKFNSLAVLNGFGKTESTAAVWQEVMFDQFHDILGGCCIRAALQDAVRSFGGAHNAASQMLNRAVQALAWNIDTSKGLDCNWNRRGYRTVEQNDLGVPFIVFNPNSWAVSQAVDTSSEYASVTDDDGNAVAGQIIRSTVTNEATDKRCLRFVAEVPAFGWRVYWVYGSKRHKYELKNTVKVSENEIENNWLKIRLENGRLAGIFDKISGRELLRGVVSATVIDEEHCDTWAHGVMSFDRIIGEFSDWKADIVESGDVCATVRLKGCYNSSYIEIFCTLYSQLEGLRLSFKVDWREQHKMLKLAFPTVLENGVDTCGIPYGFITRTANGKEQPMQNFVCVREGDAGLGISTDTRAAYDLKNGVLRITALRSPIFADHFGERDDRCEFTEQGEHFFELTVRPVGADITALYRAALEYNEPLVTVSGTYHKGALPTEKGMISVSEQNITVTVLKKAEDNSGDHILRCHETAGKSTEAYIELPMLGATIRASFMPQEIKTFRINGKAIYETDMLEDRL